MKFLNNIIVLLITSTLFSLTGFSHGYYHFNPDHYIKYQLNSRANQDFQNKTIFVSDQFLHHQCFDLLAPISLLNPAAKFHNELFPIQNKLLHYVAYPIVPHNQSLFIDRTVNVNNQFGQFTFSAFFPKFVLEPVVKTPLPNITLPIGLPTSGIGIAETGTERDRISRYICYEIFRYDFNPGRGLFRDQFGLHRFSNYFTTKYLCNPIRRHYDTENSESSTEDNDGSLENGNYNNPSNHLLCFEPNIKFNIKRKVQLSNQYHVFVIETVKEEEVCVPSYKYEATDQCEGSIPNQGICNGECPANYICLPQPPLGSNSFSEFCSCQPDNQ